MIAEIAQAAAQAAQPTSQAVTWAAVGMTAVTSVGAWLTILVGNRKRSRAAQSHGYPYSVKPGEGKACDEHARKLETHGNRLAVIETNYKNVTDDIAEIKGDVKTLLGRVPEK